MQGCADVSEAIGVSVISQSRLPLGKHKHDISKRLWREDSVVLQFRDISTSSGAALPA